MRQILSFTGLLHDHLAACQPASSLSCCCLSFCIPGARPNKHNTPLIPLSALHCTLRARFARCTPFSFSSLAAHGSPHRLEQCFLPVVMGASDSLILDILTTKTTTDDREDDGWVSFCVGYCGLVAGRCILSAHAVVIFYFEFLVSSPSARTAPALVCCGAVVTMAW